MDTEALEGIMRMNKRSANIMDTQILSTTGLSHNPLLSAGVMGWAAHPFPC